MLNPTQPKIDSFGSGKSIPSKIFYKNNQNFEQVVYNEGEKFELIVRAIDQQDHIGEDRMLVTYTKDDAKTVVQSAGTQTIQTTTTTAATTSACCCSDGYCETLTGHPCPPADNACENICTSRAQNVEISNCKDSAKCSKDGGTVACQARS
jgi:hypothetical protein